MMAMMFPVNHGHSVLWIFITEGGPPYPPATSGGPAGQPPASQLHNPELYTHSGLDRTMYSRVGCRRVDERLLDLRL